MTRLSIALVHHPVVDRHDEIYTTAITNIDVHDIARSSCTFGLDAYYLVTPITAQQELAACIANFWVEGSGQKRNVDRARAMELVAVTNDLEAAITKETAIAKKPPLIISTSAKPGSLPPISYDEGRALLEKHDCMLVFGTGHGLAPSIIERSDYLLEPVHGRGDYNHLSVRSAVAIILDRLRSSYKRSSIVAL